MPESTPEQDEHQPQQEFATWLLAVNNGVTHAELTHSLPKLVQASLETGKPSKLRLTIIVKPLAGNLSQVQVTAQVDETLPPADPAQTLMFADPSGNLTRDNPALQMLPGFGHVATAPPPTRIVGAPTPRKDS